MRAFYIDGSHHIHKVVVRAQHHLVDEGFTVPVLDDYFHDVVNLVRTWVYHNFVVFHHERLVPERQSEFIICRRGINYRALVNLRPKDRKLVRPMIKAYAPRPLIEPSYTYSPPPRFWTNHGLNRPVIIPGPCRVMLVSSYVSSPLSLSCLNIDKPERLIAYYYGVNRDIGRFLMTTDHIFVDDGWSVPRLDGFFGIVGKVTSITIGMNVTAAIPALTYFLIICNHFEGDAPTTGLSSCELIIFRRGGVGNTLVNLRTADIARMNGVIDW